LIPKSKTPTAVSSGGCFEIVVNLPIAPPTANRTHDYCVSLPRDALQRQIARGFYMGDE
jgi:hypothetical protein